jgi:outer membrane protein assembly factor BamD (BamD/ComL family)
VSPEKRISKKQMKQDSFISSALKASEYIQQNKTYFYGGLAGVIIIILVVYFVSYSGTQKTVNSENLYGEAQISAAMGQPNQAIANYKSLLDQYGSSKIADRGCYYLAKTYYESGEYDSALVYFNQYLNQYGKEPLLVEGAYAGAASCYEKKEDHAAAGENFFKAGESATNEYSAPDYYLAAGLNYTKAEMPEKAKESYQKIVDNYPRSPKFSIARKKLEEVQYAQN